MILYVEHSSDDAFFFARSLKRLAPKMQFRHVNTIHDAKCYLKGEGTYQDRNEYPFPDLVIADSKLSDGPATELLLWTKSRPEFAALTFCLFTDLPPHLRGRVLESLADKICLLDKPSHLADWNPVIQRILDCHPKGEEIP